uniref:Bro-N domain-containing protein n=1 Tax=viral metagenome TaxID=1070528 RepID=A0A6C0AGJ0_9ZZZZ
MATPKPITIEAKQYYNSKDLFAYNPEFYYGCKTKPRIIIQKKNIPPIDYIYANLKANEWNLSTEECKKAQLLIAKSWVDIHYFKPVPVQSTEAVESSPEVVESDIKTLSLVHLEDAEKFKDANGEILEIETCGEKTRNGIYFKVQDVMKAFDIPKLDDTLYVNHTSYERGVDYDTFFIATTPDNVGSPTIKKGLYLTYHGMLRVLFVTRNKKVHHFQSWAEDKLFTIQMGAKEDKMKLGTEILNINIKTYKSVFDSCAVKFPSIYLFSLGKVDLLRDTFGIDPTVPDEHTVYKFGCTGDLGDRCVQLGYKYNKLPNVDLKLSVFHMVDTKYTFDAENEIRFLCKSFKKSLKTDGHNELIVLDQSEHEMVKKYYSKIGSEYAGATSELQKEVLILKDRIKEMEHERDLEREQTERKLTEKDYLLDRERTEKLLERERLETLRTQMATNEMIYNLKLQLVNSRLTKACPEETLVGC